MPLLSCPRLASIVRLLAGTTADEAVMYQFPFARLP